VLIASGVAVINLFSGSVRHDWRQEHRAGASVAASPSQGCLPCSRRAHPLRLQPLAGRNAVRFQASESCSKLRLGGKGWWPGRAAAGPAVSIARTTAIPVQPASVRCARHPPLCPR
jgi:hypothetical protein